MSTQEQRKRFKAYNQARNEYFAKFFRGYPEPMPTDLIDLECGAKTRAGTPCKQKAIYINGRCKWHGGLSTGAKTKEGKKRSAMNGLCPKKKTKS